MEIPKSVRICLSLALHSALAIAPCFAAASIVSPPGASFPEKLAAKEIRRYVYLRTGELLPVTQDAAGRGDLIRLAVDKELKEQAYRLVTRKDGDRRVLWIQGGSPVGVLYGAYAFAEKLGVRFGLDGDVVPDERIPWALPDLDETHAPIFDIRGINPFHDFAEGPDWWNEDDYLVYIAQLAKLRMNFIGFHCYPEGGIGPEPLVWIGREGDFDPATGEVKESYPARWASTLGGAWGYARAATSDYSAGASALFASDWFGPSVMEGCPFEGQTPGQSNLVFDRAAHLLNRAFSLAARLGVKTCIGTETPLILPAAVRKRLEKAGENPEDPAVIQEVYRGIFSRIAAAHPLDYYWLWTPEGWTWNANRPEEYSATLQDLKAALGALKELGSPFTLATCGWVLGPAQDRSALHRDLPLSCPMSCINRQVGHDPVEPAFAQLAGRPAWAIPWMENDPNLTGPQPWAGRMRADAADARRYGCSGLLGIHWRTHILSMNVASLAQAAWDPSYAEGVRAAEPLGDPAFQDYEADASSDQAGRVRTMPVKDFYLDFARARFGPEAAEEAAALFNAMDGAAFPEVTAWLGGPGGIPSCPEPWEKESARFAFVDELSSLRPKIQGAGNLARFDYWLETLRYARAVRELSCRKGELDRLMAEIGDAPSSGARGALAERALAVRVAMARLWEKLITLQIAAVETPGELGTLANLEQHSRLELHVLDGHDKNLAEALGRPLPPEVQPTKDYLGEDRIVVPTRRSLAEPGDSLSIRVLLPSKSRVQSARLLHRPMGSGSTWKESPLEHVGRAVYRAALPVTGEDAECYIEVHLQGGRILRWPPTAPELNHTIVVME